MRSSWVRCSFGPLHKRRDIVSGADVYCIDPLARPSKAVRGRIWRRARMRSAAMSTIKAIIGRAPVHPQNIVGNRFGQTAHHDKCGRKKRVTGRGIFVRTMHETDPAQARPPRWIQPPTNISGMLPSAHKHAHKLSVNNIFSTLESRPPSSYKLLIYMCYLALTTEVFGCGVGIGTVSCLWEGACADRLRQKS